jgi:hypothetical protein
VTSFRPGVRRQRPSCGELPPQPGGTPCWVSGSWERRSVSIWQTQFVGRRLRPTTNARLKYSFWFTTYAFRYSLYCLILTVDKPCGVLFCTMV